MSRELSIAPNIKIPADELQFTFARSAGPGGQNVNKVNTKAVLRWAVARSTSVPDDFRHRFLQRYSGRINNDGELVLASDRYRRQARNRNACLEKLREMAAAVAAPPRRRIRTRPTRAAVERRLKDKQRRSLTKQRRGFRGADE